MNPEMEIKLEKMVYGGQAMGYLEDGRPVFIPYALPGEVVKAQLTEEKPHYAHAELLELILPSCARIQPRCQHFTVCGGCHYQHLSYQDQLMHKTTVLHDQLQRIGKMDDIPIQPAIASQVPWNYRNHMQFHITNQGKLGLLKHHTDKIIAIDECHLPTDAINIVWPLLDIEPVPGLKRISLRADDNDDILLILESSEAETPEISIEGLPISIIHTSPAGQLVLAGSDQISISILGRKFQVTAGSFFQVNSSIASQMIEHLLANLPFGISDTCIELYSGVGLFSAFLAPRVKRLIAIESSSQACQDFMINLDEYENVDLYEATAEQVLPNLELTADLVMVDPPRSGLSKTVLQRLFELRPTMLVYVSCDPATLARDARHIKEIGYQLKNITPFDMFPQTYHIESISFWEA